MSPPLEFHRPEGLWLLLLLPLLWWLHRPRGSRFPTDRLGIWQRALARLPRLRRKPLTHALLLSLAAAFFLVLSLAGPRLPARPGLRLWLGVLDHSPSMATRDQGGRSRLEAARTLCARDLLGLPPWIPAKVYGLEGNRLRLLGERTPGREGWEVWKPLGRARLDLARELALRSGPGCGVVLYSDGAGPSPWPQALPGGGRNHLAFRGLGSPDTPNPGALLAAEIEDPWPGPSLRLRLRLKAGTGPRKLLLEGGGYSRAFPLSPEAGPFEVLVPRRPGLRLRLEPGDLFGLDDHLSLEPRPPWSPRLRRRPPGALEPLQRFLEASLGGGGGDGELELLEGGSLEVLPRDGRVRFCFGTRLPGMVGTEAFEGPPDWDRSDPLLRGLDLSPIQAERRLTGPLPEAARVLARAGGEPFILLDREHRLLWFGVRLGESNLATRAFLPVLCLRSLALLARGPGATRMEGLLDPLESEIAARRPPEVPGAPAWFRPARPLYKLFLALTLTCLLLRFILSLG